jgi:16S rRNA U1498 N3-methylase RsmE
MVSEKATEIGIQEIIPLICERTERQHYRSDRMKSIVISAMLQSQQVWLPKYMNRYYIVHMFLIPVLQRNL